MPHRYRCSSDLVVPLNQYGGRRHIPRSRARIHHLRSNVELVMKTGCHVGIGQARCLLIVLMLGLAGFPGGAPAMPVGEPGCFSAEDCDDRDPCTRDDCNPDGTCTAVAYTGDTAVTCACERIVPEVCGGTLPPRRAKTGTRACLAAARASGERQTERRQLRVARRAFGSAARRADQLARNGRVSPECAAAFRSELMD